MVLNYQLQLPDYKFPKNLVLIYKEGRKEGAREKRYGPFPNGRPGCFHRKPLSLQIARSRHNHPVCLRAKVVGT